MRMRLGVNEGNFLAIPAFQAFHKISASSRLDFGTEIVWTND